MHSNNKSKGSDKKTKKVIAFCFLLISFGIIIYNYSSDAELKKSINSNKVDEANTSNIVDNNLSSQNSTYTEGTLHLDYEIQFNSYNFEQVVRTALNKPSGAITIGDASKITELNAHEKWVRDITGIKYFTNLTKLDLFCLLHNINGQSCK